MKISPEIQHIRTLNGEALNTALKGEFSDAYRIFMWADDAQPWLHPDAETIMAGSDTLRDWGMTYARDAASIEISTELTDEEKARRISERDLLFDAAEQVIFRAKQKAEPLVMNPQLYSGKRQLRRGTNTFWIAESVATRARTLRKVILGGPWGDDPGYGAAYAELKPSYWAVTAASQPLRYIRAKEQASNENIANSKSTLLHMIPWMGRTATMLFKTTVSPYESIKDKAKAWGHAVRIARSLRTQALARDSIRRHP